MVSFLSGAELDKLGFTVNGEKGWHAWPGGEECPFSGDVETTEIDLGGHTYRVCRPALALLPHDAVNHPKHYTSHPSGVECIQITEHMGFNLGNALKYIWRADLKNDAIEDLKKAAWYVQREIELRERVANATVPACPSSGSTSSEASGTSPRTKSPSTPVTGGTPSTR